MRLFDIDMKRIILSLAIAACAVTASGQPERGTFSIIPRVGVAIANISNESFVYDESFLIEYRKVPRGADRWH